MADPNEDQVEDYQNPAPRPLQGDTDTALPPTPSPKPAPPPYTGRPQPETYTGGLPDFSGDYGILQQAQKRIEGDTTRLGANAQALGEARRKTAREILAEPMPTVPDVPNLPKPPTFEETQPVQAFGSFATILGAIGGLLTRQPLTASMNAAAAAMNSIHQRDINQYNYHYKEWQAQSENVVRLAQWQNQRYQALMTQRGQTVQDKLTAMSIEAATHSDDVAIHTLKTGDLSAAEKLLTDRISAAKGLEDSRQNIFKLNDEVQHRWEQEQRQLQADRDLDKYRTTMAARPMRSSAGVYALAEAVKAAELAKGAAAGQAGTRVPLEPTEFDAIHRKVQEDEAAGKLLNTQAQNQGKADVAERRAKSYDLRTQTLQKIAKDKNLLSYDQLRSSDWHKTREEELKGQNIDQQHIDRILHDETLRLLEEGRNARAQQADETKRMGQMATERVAQDKTALQREIAAGKLDFSYDKLASGDAQAEAKLQQTEWATKLKDDLVRAGYSNQFAMNEARIRAKEALGGGPMTANYRDKLRVQVDQFANSQEVADRTLATLDRSLGAAGLAGRARRLGEVVGNVLGSDSTDMKQFQRDINYLQVAAHRLITESAGRPLAAEAARIDEIIGGLHLGDTTANTIRALTELKQLYAKMRGDTLSRLNGTWTPDKPGIAGATPPPATPGGAATVVPRSSAAQPWLSDPVAQ